MSGSWVIIPVLIALTVGDGYVDELPHHLDSGGIHEVDGPAVVGFRKGIAF